MLAFASISFANFVFVSCSSHRLISNSHPHSNSFSLSSSSFSSFITASHPTQSRHTPTRNPYTNSNPRRYPSMILNDSASATQLVTLTAKEAAQSCAAFIVGVTTAVIANWMGRQNKLKYQAHDRIHKSAVGQGKSNLHSNNNTEQDLLHDHLEHDADTENAKSRTFPPPIPKSPNKIYQEVLQSIVQCSSRATGSAIIWDIEGHLVTNLSLLKKNTISQSSASAATGSAATNANASTSLGSGIIKSGEAASAASSASSASSISTPSNPKITIIQSGKSIDAYVVGVDTDRDIVVLKVDPEKIFQGKEKDSSHPVLLPFPRHFYPNPKVGDQVYTVCNPSGSMFAFSSGLISSVENSLKTTKGKALFGAILTDASFNTNASGTVLVDAYGKLLGLSSYVFTKVNNSSGFRFMLPVDCLETAVESILRDKKKQRPVIGVGIMNSKARPPHEQNPDGVIILEVPRGSPAHQAGLRGSSTTNSGDLILGDVIIAVNDFQVKTEDELFEQLSKYEPGDVVTLKLRRGIDLKLGKLVIADVDIQLSAMNADY